MDELKKTIVPILKANDVEFAGIFGSVARGEETTQSDIDVLVRFSKPKSLLEFVGIEQRLSTALQKKIDLVSQRSLCPHIKNRVMKDLVVLYGQRA